MGADTPDGGELVRLLAMHPDVEITELQARGMEGKPVTSHHHGLIGETDLCFTGSVDYQKCDVLFVCSDTVSKADINRIRLSRPDLKLICLSRKDDSAEPGFVYGIPEINRKLLVRGATAAVVPESFASMALVALFPFASRLLLGGDIDIAVSAPANIIAETDSARVCREIETELHDVQQSFNGRVTLTETEFQSRRSALMDIVFDCALDLEQMLGLYEIYDDHNFSFATTRRVGVSEVAGTNKCVVTVAKDDDGKAHLSVAADCRLRGASGEAVHIMNLMCGLHEKTGLRLKAIDFDPVE